MQSKSTSLLFALSQLKEPTDNMMYNEKWVWNKCDLTQPRNT